MTNRQVLNWKMTRARSAKSAPPVRKVGVKRKKVRKTSQITEHVIEIQSDLLISISIMGHSFMQISNRQALNWKVAQARSTTYAPSIHKEGTKCEKGSCHQVPLSKILAASTVQDALQSMHPFVDKNNRCWKCRACCRPIALKHLEFHVCKKAPVGAAAVS